MFAIVQSQTGVALRRRPSAASTRSGLRRSVRAAASGKKDAPKKEEEKDEPKIDMAGLSQLIKMGLGTISGDIKEINLDDPTRTVVMELEANNFEDADGNPLNFMNNEKRVVTSPTRGMARVRLYGTGVVDEGEKPPILNYVAPVILGVAALGGVAATLNAL